MNAQRWTCPNCNYKNAEAAYSCKWCQQVNPNWVNPMAQIPAQPQEGKKEDMPVQPMEYAQFNKEYYFNIISSNSWIQSMNIEKDIIEQISLFSKGMIKDCHNNNCNYEVLIFDKHLNFFEKIPKNQSSYNDFDDEAEPFPKVEIKDSYYYNPSDDISYCPDCTKSIKPCCEGGWQICCTGIIIETESSSFIECGCNNQYHPKKKLCSKHTVCQTCKTTFCGESCRNVVNKEDMCQMFNMFKKWMPSMHSNDINIMDFM